MKESFLEVGKILNTHGVRGELKTESWCDSPEDLCELETVYVGGKAYSVRNSRIHGPFVLLTLEGVRSIDDALPSRERSSPPAGRMFRWPRAVTLSSISLDWKPATPRAAQYWAK